jgi:hypothetical protein
MGMTKEQWLTQLIERDYWRRLIGMALAEHYTSRPI